MASPLAATFTATPLTERGTAGKIDVQEDGSWLCYASGKTVILRDARKPTACDTCALLRPLRTGRGLTRTPELEHRECRECREPPQ